MQSARLANKAKDGDMQSFEQLVILYQDRIYALAKRLTGSVHDADDLAQEVFLRAYRYIGSFRGDSDFGTWLHKIAVNAYINTKRSNRTVSFVSIDEQRQTDEGNYKIEVADTAQGPEETFFDKEFGESLQRALDSLPKEQKAAIILREVEECTYEEIAVLMSCSLGTVRSRLARARETLRVFFAKSEHKVFSGREMISERRTSDAV